MSIKKILIAIITIVITVDAGGQIQADGQKWKSLWMCIPSLIFLCSKR